VTLSKDKGTRGETGLVRALGRLGVDARRVAPLGVNDQGDVHSKDTCWQVKAGEAAIRASEVTILGWMDDTEAQADRAGLTLPILVTQRYGYSHERVEHWWAWVRTRDLGHLEGTVGTSQFPAQIADYPVRYPVQALAPALFYWGIS
jgi:hypothetical protein